MSNHEINFAIIKVALEWPHNNFRGQTENVAPRGKMVILHLECRKCHFYILRIIEACMLILGVILHKLINNQVVMSTLARKLLWKSSINIVASNRKVWSAYHCILDHIISILIPFCWNHIGSNVATANRSMTNHLEGS